MVEITPILPSPTVTGVTKVRRDEGRKNKQEKPPAEKGEEHERPDDGQPRQHIDERV